MNLTIEPVKTMMKWFNAFLWKCSESYYNGKDSILDDHQFDMMVKALWHMEQAFPKFKEKNSVTSVVGK